MPNHNVLTHISDRSDGQMAKGILGEEVLEVSIINIVKVVFLVHI